MIMKKSNETCRAFVDALSMDDGVDVNKSYPLENHQTILQVDYMVRSSLYSYSIPVSSGCRD